MDAVRRRSAAAFAVAIAFGHRATIAVGLAHCLWWPGLLHDVRVTSAGGPDVFVQEMAIARFAALVPFPLSHAVCLEGYMPLVFRLEQNFGSAARHLI